MASLQHSALDARSAVALPVPAKTADAKPAPQRRSVSLMRKYEVAALQPDMSITTKQVIAPATPLFEETASAFARGTLIATETGPVAVEDLLPGDRVETGRGLEAAVWIGSTVFVPNTPASGSSLNNLYRITAETFGFGRPMVDLLVGPAARMTVRREKLQSLIGNATVLAPVRDFEDDDRIFAVTPPGSVQLYHVALQRHGTINAGGFELESYHPGRTIAADLGQNMRALFLSMFPNLEMLEDFGELTMTRTTRVVIDDLMSG